MLKSAFICPSICLYASMEKKEDGKKKLDSPKIYTQMRPFWSLSHTHTHTPTSACTNLGQALLTSYLAIGKSTPKCHLSLFLCSLFILQLGKLGEPH